MQITINLLIPEIFYGCLKVVSSFYVQIVTFAFIRIPFASRSVWDFQLFPTIPSSSLKELMWSTQLKTAVTSDIGYLTLYPLPSMQAAKARSNSFRAAFSS
jgi:hypothetical protein